MSSDGVSWMLLNASPDLRHQIEQCTYLHPRDGLRSSPIAAVVLTGGDVDAIAGLLTLRERQAFTLYATNTVHSILDSNPVFDVLARDVVRRDAIVLNAPLQVGGPDGDDIGLSVELFAVPGKIPLYLEESQGTPPIVLGEGTVGALIGDGTKQFFFIPSCAEVSPQLSERLRGATLVFFDGTLWSDSEMIAAGIGEKTGRRMGHISVSGADGSMRAFAPLGVQRSVFLHINNSNPILLSDSPERAEVERSGWEVAFDGMEVEL